MCPEKASKQKSKQVAAEPGLIIDVTQSMYIEIYLPNCGGLIATYLVI